MSVDITAERHKWRITVALTLNNEDKGRKIMMM